MGKSIIASLQEQAAITEEMPGSLKEVKHPLVIAAVSYNASMAWIVAVFHQARTKAV